MALALAIRRQKVYMAAGHPHVRLLVLDACYNT